tara:strand:+ start:796 stop:996 length:201 start_codon:yes stop_codon:yes gene_type:complete
MITKEQLDATYHQFLTEHAQLLEEEDKTIETINGFEWDYKQFNNRMIELYPEANHITKYYIKRRTR